MRKRKMIVCALEEEWIARLLERLSQEEWQTQMIDHAETLWEVQAPCSAIMIQEEELTEAYRWRTKDAGDSICLQAFREFAEWQKVPIIVILQQRDDRLEEQLLRAGAAECVCPEQSTDLAACRIARAVSKNVVSDVPMTEWERVIVDSEGGQVQIDGYPIHMSREECILLKRLLQAEGAVVYRDGGEFMERSICAQPEKIGWCCAAGAQTFIWNKAFYCVQIWKRVLSAVS